MKMNVFFSDSVLWKTGGARINKSIRVHKALLHLFQFGYSEENCSTYHMFTLFFIFQFEMILYSVYLCFSHLCVIVVSSAETLCLYAHRPNELPLLLVLLFLSHLLEFFPLNGH